MDRQDPNKPLGQVASRRPHPTTSLSGSCNEIVIRSFAVKEILRFDHRSQALWPNGSLGSTQVTRLWSDRALLDRLKNSDVIDNHFLGKNDIIVCWVRITRPVTTDSHVHNQEKGFPKRCQVRRIV